MQHRFNLLLVDDDRENLELLQRIFRVHYNLHVAENGKDALVIIQSQPIDLLITDFRMPGMNGVELMESARKINPHIVRIVLTGYSDPLDIIDAINRGEAYRYLTKPFKPDELQLTVKQAVEIYQLQQERENMVAELQIQNQTLLKTQDELRTVNEELEERVEERTIALAEANNRLEHSLEEVTRLARTDSLTGLWNRRYFFEMADRELQVASRFGQQLSVLMIDLDHFKRVNDKFGHLVGDKVLKNTAQSLSVTVRNIDLCGRYGGEEFLVLLPQTPIDGAKRVASRILEMTPEISFGLPTDHSPAPLPLTVSIGLSIFPMHAQKWDDLVNVADKALYKAKAKGRNRLEVPE